MCNPFQRKEIAQSYDDFYKTKVGQMYDQLEKETITELIGRRKRGLLLEVGCGTGHWSEYFTNLNYEVIGIDNSSAMIDVARQKNISNVVFTKSDAEYYTTDKIFDTLAFITTLEFLKKPKKVLENVIQYLASEGYIIIGVLNRESFLGRTRQESEGIYSEAHFYTEQEIYELFSPYAKEITLQQCAFAGPSEIDEYTEIERQGKQKNRKDGNFIAGVIDI